MDVLEAHMTTEETYSPSHHMGYSKRKRKCVPYPG
jgi:hypothetical protein